MWERIRRISISSSASLTLLIGSPRAGGGVFPIRHRIVGSYVQSRVFDEHDYEERERHRVPIDSFFHFTEG